MSNKIIYPILIIIFSILVIYAILNKKNNDKLNKGIENFQNTYFEKEKEKIRLNISNNTKITKDFANGTWSTIGTVVNSDYTVTGLMTINVERIIDISNNNAVNISSSSYGSLSIFERDFDINFIMNENLTAVDKTFPAMNLHIKFLNKFNDEKNININQPFYIPETLNAVVTIFIGDAPILKHASYKVYDNKVGAEVYRIIKSNNIFIDKPPPVYDFNAYNVIIDTYKFGANYLSLNFGETNTIIATIIKEKYLDNINFSIQRVFKSPTGVEIKTKNSPPILLNALDRNGRIPSTIVIDPFSNDKSVNSLTTFFEPLATILYFYQLVNVDETYSFKNNNIIMLPSQVMKLQNNANNMFDKIIEGKDINSIQKINNNTYKMFFGVRVGSDLNSQTIINFSDIISKL